MRAILERTVEISQPGATAMVRGELVLPMDAKGVVVFAHGSGSSRHSPRNGRVAQDFQRRGLGTLLMDLLTDEEEAIDRRTRHLRFDINLLSDRLVNATAWLAGEDDAAGLAIGYFGASTGAAAALAAAARRPDGIAAIVSRGGRPDLADVHLAGVRAPTLLIVGELDTAVINLNRAACDQMKADCVVQIVPGATHLFEEPGALDEVSRLAGDWFARYLARPLAATGDTGQPG